MTFHPREMGSSEEHVNAAWGGVTLAAAVSRPAVGGAGQHAGMPATAADQWQIEAEGLNIRSPLLSLWSRQQIISAGCGFYVFIRDAAHPCLMRGWKTAGELGGYRKGTSYQLALN